MVAPVVITSSTRRMVLFLSISQSFNSNLPSTFSQRSNFFFLVCVFVNWFLIRLSEHNGMLNVLLKPFANSSLWLKPLCLNFFFMKWYGNDHVRRSYFFTIFERFRIPAAKLYRQFSVALVFDAVKHLLNLSAFLEHIIAACF